jgi:putative tryptophan/tyrosine transport system substrate-binding protein
MDRRAFIIMVGVLAAPFAAGAQPGKIARIGYLSPLSAVADSLNREAFLKGLRDLGYVDGHNAVIEARYADGSSETLRSLAAEIVRLKVDVIVAGPTPAVRAVQQATRTIPIVAFSGDPVGESFIAALARPGGNITGLSSTGAEIAAKRVEFLKAIVPKLSHVAHLEAPDAARRMVAETEAAGRTLGVRVINLFVRNPRDLNSAFSTVRSERVGGLIVALAVKPYWPQIIDFALKNRLPTVSGPREFVEAGGLMASGPDYSDLFRRAATYVDKILKGAKPADLPVEQPTKFELVINLKTARAVDLRIPPSVLGRADQVIE